MCDSIPGVVDRTTYEAVNRPIYGALYMAVWQAVGNALWQATDPGPSRRVPPHHALEEFLREVKTGV
jgi:hypothetical protein